MHLIRVQNRETRIYHFASDRVQNNYQIQTHDEVFLMQFFPNLKIGVQFFIILLNYNCKTVKTLSISSDVLRVDILELESIGCNMLMLIHVIMVQKLQIYHIRDQHQPCVLRYQILTNINMHIFFF